MDEIRKFAAARGAKYPIFDKVCPHCIDRLVCGFRSGVVV